MLLSLLLLLLMLLLLLQRKKKQSLLKKLKKQRKQKKLKLKKKKQLLQLLQLLQQSNSLFANAGKSRIERCGFFCAQRGSIVPVSIRFGKIPGKEDSLRYG